MLKALLRTTSLLSFLSVSLTTSAALTVSSDSSPDGSVLTQTQVFKGFGCSGENISPDLRWTAGPAGTKSYAVTMYDPDAPTGSGWWHWVVYNLPAETISLAEGVGTPAGDKLPKGSVQANTDFGGPGFGGACPPKDDKPHRYIISVYALGIEKIELPTDATAAMVGYMIHANMLDKGNITTTYSR